MSGLIGALRVTLGADTANFEKGMKRARSEMGAMQKASGALKTAFAGMVGLLAFDQFAALAKSGLEYASSLGEVATQLGVSTRALQEYRYAASQAGIEQGEMDKALSQLTRRLGAAASGAKAPSEALKRLGVDLRDAKGNIIDAGEAIPLIAEGLKNIESPAERAKILVDLFGKAGQQLAPLMEGGAAGVNGLRDAAHKLGLVLSDKLIADADEAADKMAALKQVLEAKIASAVSENAGAIVELVNALGKLIDYAGKAARAWRYFADLDWSPGAGSFSEQFARIQKAELGPGVELTRQSTPVELGMIAANKARDAQRLPAKVDKRFLGPSGGSLGAPRRRAPAMTPWGPAVSPGLSRAVGSSAFGGNGPSDFAPGLGGSGWIKAATSGYDDLATRSAEVAASTAAAKVDLSEMARDHGPRLLASVKALSPAMDELRARAQGILDRLFPEEADARQFKDELAVLDAAMAKGALSAEDHRRSVEALRHEFNGLTEAMRAAVNIEYVTGPSLENMVDQIAARAEDALDATRKNAEATRVQVVESFRDMTQGALREFDRLSSAIRGGGFLDILSSVIGLGLQLGGSGLFGKKVQANINSVPGRAFGGPVMANTPYIVGERRAELFVPSSSGRIEPNPGSGRRGGGDTYNFSGNLLTPEWWAEIQRRDDEAAARGAMGGVSMVAERSQKQARNRLGRR